MKSEDRDQIGEIYENLNFKSSFDKRHDPVIEDMKHQANQSFHNIEQSLEGTINYYSRYLKNEYLQNPNDQGKLDEIKKFSMFCSEYLGQFRNWTRD